MHPQTQGLGSSPSLSLSHTDPPSHSLTLQLQDEKSVSPLHPVDTVPLVCFRAHSFWLLHIFTETQRLLPVARRWLNAVYSKRKCGPNQNNMPVMTHADDFLPSKWNNMAKITCFRYWFICLYQSFEPYKKKKTFLYEGFLVLYAFWTFVQLLQNFFLGENFQKLHQC